VREGSNGGQGAGNGGYVLDVGQSLLLTTTAGILLAGWDFQGPRASSLGAGPHPAVPGYPDLVLGSGRIVVLWFGSVCSD